MEEQSFSSVNYAIGVSYRLKDLDKVSFKIESQEFSFHKEESSTEYSIASGRVLNLAIQSTVSVLNKKNTLLRIPFILEKTLAYNGDDSGFSGGTTMALGLIWVISLMIQVFILK